MYCPDNIDERFGRKRKELCLSLVGTIPQCTGKGNQMEYTGTRRYVGEA